MAATFIKSAAFECVAGFKLTPVSFLRNVCRNREAA